MTLALPLGIFEHVNLLYTDMHTSIVTDMAFRIFCLKKRVLQRKTLASAPSEAMVLFNFLNPEIHRSSNCGGNLVR